MSRVTTELKAAKKEAARYSQEIQDLWKKAKDDDNRDATEEEQEEILAKVKAIETCKERITGLEAQKATEDEIKRVGVEMGGVTEVAPPENGKNYPVPVREANIGEMFVNSPQFKSIEERGFSGQFSTGMIDLSTKGTLLEGSGSPGSGSGGGLLAVPQVIPGVVEKLFQRLTVADLLGSVQASGNSLRYVVEGTATSGAAGVAEGGAKPESTLGLGTTDEPIKKIATTLVISDEMLEDAPAVQSYINGRLSLFIKIEEERQLVGGGGTNELVGLTGRGVNTHARGTVDNNAVALFKALNGTRGSALLEPDAIVMNPANWQSTRLLTDANGQLFGGGPFTGAYGNGGIYGNIQSGQLAPPSDSIWNKPVIVTTAIGAGTALLGSFSMAAAVLRRSGLTVEASNSHSDYFTKNLVAIRAEQRLGLACYRPVAFTLVTGLS